MELTGNGFVLRNWYTDDATSLQRHADNPNVAACLLDRFPSPYTLQDAVNWINAKIDQDPVINFAIAAKGNVIGGIAVDFRQDVYRKTPLLGYWLSEEYWGRGIMPQAVKLITAYAFAKLDVICIQAFILSCNPKSMRVLEKAGYEKQGVLKQSIIKGNVILDEHAFAAFNPVG